MIQSTTIEQVNTNNTQEKSGKSPTIKILKNGYEDPYDPIRLFRYIYRICEIHKIKLSEEEIHKLTEETTNNLKPVTEHKTFVEIMCKITEHFKIHNYSYGSLSTILYVDHIHKYTPITFYDFIMELNERELINPVYVDFTKKYKSELNKMIDNSRDYLYSYLGLLVLEQQNYLYKHKGRLLERPQYMHARVALNLFAGPHLLGKHSGKSDQEILTDIKQYYDMISRLEYTNATPTLFNSCHKSAQLNSCFLTEIGDSAEQIMDNLKHHALISKCSGGIGSHLDGIRPNGTSIAGIGRSTGIVRILKQYDSAALCWDQGGGKRKAAFAFYMQMHHGDLMEFLEMKLVGGSEDTRCRQLYPALMVCDLFIERVIRDDKWSFFDTSDKSPCAELRDLYGAEYKAAYIKHEEAGRALKTMPAAVIFDKVCNVLASTGSLYICFKDHINRKSNQKNIGTIKSSNLCTEIMEYSDDKSYASCTLASAILRNYVVEGNGDKPTTFDYARLYTNTKLIVRALDNVIDITKYPVRECISNAMDYRPIGIGIQGLADVFMAFKIPFISQEAEAIDRRIAETMYYAALEASAELAHERGAYSRYEGSPISQGILQYDMWRDDLGDLANPTDKYDWDALKRLINKHGVRHSLLIAHMPTVSTANICNSTECFEPITSNVFTKSTLSGKYLYINTYLQKHLTELGIWDNVCDKIRVNDGSIQEIKEIPENIREIYKTVYEIKGRELHRRSAIRATMIDQSSSLNLYSNTVDARVVGAAILSTHKLGFKTGIYYYRGKTKADPIKNNDAIKRIIDMKTKSTNDKNNKIDDSKDDYTQNRDEDLGPVCRKEEGCIMCSS